MKDFFKKIDKCLVGGSGVIVFGILGYIGWVCKPGDTISIHVLYIVIIISYLICIIIYAACKRDVNTIYVLPKVLEFHQVKGKIVFVVEKNELFARGHYVTVLYKEKGEKFEQLVGLGYVDTQCEEHMQVCLENNNEEYSKEMINKLRNHESVIIRPSVDRRLM